MKYQIELETGDGTLEPFIGAATKKEAMQKARFIASNCYLTDVTRLHVYCAKTETTVASYKVKRKAA